MKEQPNLSYIHQLSGGDRAFEEKLLDVVKRELPVEIDELKNNLQADNFSEAAANVHKLKHKISILGLEKSYYIAERYEDELREGNNKMQAEFEDILQRMLVFIRS
ncbi:MAG TPA: Hpt domain-containing protein [Christiangramia sp.]|nr:Hpt domain-containing protein [Christiangramia sp.]